MENQLAISNIYLQYALPYHNQFCVKYDESWANLKKRLTTHIINDALFGESSNIAYFASSYTRMISIDIDDHLSKNAWHNDIPSSVIVRKYQQVLDRIKMFPSFVIRTPRGIHCFWLFNEKTPTNIIVSSTKLMMEGVDVEIRPTMNEALRIPNFPSAVNVSDLKSIIINPTELKIYRLAELITFYLPQNQQERDNARMVSLPIYKAEKKVMETLCNGSTNNELCYLTGIYKSNGFSEDAAVAGFTKLLNNAGYSGPLTEREITNRVHCLYRGEAYNQVYHEYDISAHQDLINRLMVIMGAMYSKRALKGILALMVGILQYNEKQNMIYNDAGMRAEYNYLNTYFIADMKYGFTPLPSILLQSLNKRYAKYIKVFQAIGFLTMSDTNYKTGSYCKSYYIETDPDYLNNACDNIGVVNKQQYHKDVLSKRKGGDQK